ncbi:ester cyclase [Ensifer adhaerens]|uniref:ester cyclase n=1 Tax=Ensifer adhaerens TaxID=106592 RepID=UPI000DDBFC4C|nr:ester cyclase [Ensifer adhaerens]QHG74319.1 ester cyclase [Ensifer adhaerens]
MTRSAESEAAIAVVRRNTEEVQGKGNFAVFDEVFSEDFLDHTPQPNMVPDKEGVRGLYAGLRKAFPDFHAVIHWQTADGNLVTTFKTYYGTHKGTFLGIEPTGKTIQFETVDAMRVVDGKITEHWGVANLYSLVGQLGLQLQPKG